MGCKTAKFAYGGSASQAVGAGSSILFPTAVSRTRSIQGNGSGGIQLKSPGTYRVVSSFTLDAAAAGTVNVTMSKSGSPGYASSAGATLAAAGDLATVSIVDYVTVVGGVGGSLRNPDVRPRRCCRHQAGMRASRSRVRLLAAGDRSGTIS